MSYDYINCEISGVPSLIVHPADLSKGTVLLYHGWASTMESYLFLASLISSWGFRVIVPELPDHGVRGQLNYFDTKVVQKQFWRVVLQGVKEAEGMVSATEKVSIVGHSTGGFIAAGAFAKMACLQSAIVINGSCAWVKFEELYRAHDGRPPLTDAESRLLSGRDPMNHMNFEKDRALLLLHGKEDSTVPIDSQRYFRSVMSDVSSEQLQLVEYGGVNHQITLGMLEKMKGFLTRSCEVKP